VQKLNPADADSETPRRLSVALCQTAKIVSLVQNTTSSWFSIGRGHRFVNKRLGKKFGQGCGEEGCAFRIEMEFI
jgi:hypothetical protein